MYLVHARFETLAAEVPPGIRELARALLASDDRVEHLSVHTRSSHRFTLGFYLRADSLAWAEEHVERVSHRLLSTGRLPSARLLEARVPLLLPELRPPPGQGPVS
ncbi:hypothetical protein [Streptomyces jumonjinensis]|uniref:Uncharacterized protein n=1 Tax=Streptomyces jumonjinensis TaxID=1945 RepID=A0A646KIB1_STRJU|nr:hypothetical protein [Streptomyces jumonjinensis]MQT01943.1 hypothetical protein [Streptomyces jumonjinensis]